MKGDFTRLTFQPEKHYSSVRLQQGRVQLDADWNEQADILAHRAEITTQDSVGRSGAPLHDAGFAVTVITNGLQIGKGRYYVDGILCENDQEVSFISQPDLPVEKEELSKKESGTYLAYLDVWQRHITVLEDDDLREVALGGADTATRLKTVWQVKLAREDRLPPDEPKSTGQLRARAAEKPSNSSPQNPCDVQAGGGFRGLENQLYRVEIHTGSRDNMGNPTTPTFKWSRENGSVILPIGSPVSSDGKTTTVILKNLGRDDRLSLTEGDWVEIEDDDYVLQNRAGNLLQVDAINRTSMTVTLKGTPDSKVGRDLNKHPLLRRWDHKEGKPNEGGLQLGNDGAALIVEGQWLSLEDGVQIWFQKPNTGESNQYRTSDYWLIPARTLTRDVEWHGCDLRLMSVDTADDLVNEGRNLVIVALVSTKLHIRVFDANGKRVVDKAENELISGETLTTLKNQLNPLPDESSLSPEQKQKIIRDATSIAGHTQPHDVFQKPHGIAHHYCPLALLEFDNTTWTVKSDCRQFFLPLSEVSSSALLYYVSGDGQEAMPDTADLTKLVPLAAPLQVGANRAGASVRFYITKGGGRLQDTGITADVPTGNDGVASCKWELDPTTLYQQVEAQLLDKDGKLVLVALPIRFNANLSVASEVAYKQPKNWLTLEQKKTVQDALDAVCDKFDHLSAGAVGYTPSNCLTLGKTKTVQDALDTVCQQFDHELYYVSGDGQEAMPTSSQDLVRLVEPLQVGANRASARVRFHITQGEGHLEGKDKDTPVIVLTGGDGMASCAWELDPNTPSQQVEAQLLDEAGNSVSLPIRFNANLSVASKVAYIPSNCLTLEKTKTVQDTLDIVCQQFDNELHYVSGNGQEAMPDTTGFSALDQPLEVETKPAGVQNVRFQIITKDGNDPYGGLKASPQAAKYEPEVTVKTLTENGKNIASCIWALGSRAPNSKEQEILYQQVKAELVDGSGKALSLPIFFNANLSVASKVAYMPPANCPTLREARTVQNALDTVCQKLEPEPGIHVTAVKLEAGDLKNGAEVEVSKLANGITIVCDREVDSATITRPTCFVTLEMPFLAGQSTIGFQSLILNGELKVSSKNIIWKPDNAVNQWLSDQIKTKNPLLAHLTLKGNFIRDQSGTLYLDGEMFTGTDLSKGSGDGRRGGDFEMWFWLVPPPQPVSGQTIAPTKEPTQPRSRRSRSS